MTRARDTRTGNGRRAPAPTDATTGATGGPAGAALEARPPARVGHYRLLGELGRGGMGVVYEAEHEVLGRRVALKTLAPGRPDELARRRARFVEEARTAARLRHPAIVGVLDAGEADGQLYLVMDLVRGETLADRLDRTGALPPRAACALLLPIVDALAQAHRERIVHRDVKPANVLLDGDRPLLADFGLACDLFQTDERSPSARPMGTISHMAPEQLRGEPAGPACDVWALGVTLYECLTDRLPWDVADTQDLEGFARTQAAADPTPPRALAPEVSPALEQVVLRCLARRPEERFADAGALLAALEAARAWRAPQEAAGASDPGAPAAVARPLILRWGASSASARRPRGTSCRARSHVAPRPRGPLALAPAHHRREARLRGRLVAAIGLAAGLVAGAATTHLVSRWVAGDRAQRRARPTVEVPAEAPPSQGPAGPTTRPAA